MNGQDSTQQEFILRIKDLTIAYQDGGEWKKAVRNVSFDMPTGQVCGLVGESGSGKTTLALALMRYLPKNGQVRGGEIEFAGQDLLNLNDDQLRQVWGKEIALVPQDPLASLNPTLKIGLQVKETFSNGKRLSKDEANERLIELFESVHLSDPERVADSYPHQISGGMLQRVMIAMALSTEPKLLVLDEPTSSLDVTTVREILDLLRELIHERDTSVLYITHNLGVISQVSDRVLVMYAGEVFEDAPTKKLIELPLHPYTQGLLDSVPILGQHKTQTQLRPIMGQIPSLDELPSGCIFRPRCPLAIEVCKEYPPLYDAGDGQTSRCHRWEEIANHEVSPKQPEPDEVLLETSREETKTILKTENVEVYFSKRLSLMDLLTGETPPKVKAVNGVDISIPQGRTLGLVGESGSGKTTLARAIVGLDKRTGGEIFKREEHLSAGLRGRSNETLGAMQIVFQNPKDALNPYLSIGEILRRPIMRLRNKSREEADALAKDLLQKVNLSEDLVSRLPGQLSGGQKQRVAIAQAFAPNPDLFVADEPVTSLDVSVQASILCLLNDLQAELGNSTLFISHNLAVVSYLSDDVAVMYLGQLMELGSVDAVMRPPYHPYTEALLSAVPVISTEKKEDVIELKDEIPSPSEEISGCPFHTRCHRFLGDICVDETPPWREDPETGKRIFCHIPLDELRADQDAPSVIQHTAEAA